MVNIVNSSILEQISLAKANMEADPRFDLIKKQRIFSYLNKTASSHSVDIELLNGTRHGRAKKIALGNLSLAREYLSKGRESELTEDKLKVAAALINDFQSGSMNYRLQTGRTETSNETFIYLDFTQIPNEIYKFLEENKSLASPVDRAINSHFQIARIHPFDDGNGRLARLVQNAYLECAGYPPILVAPFEKGNYVRLIGAASRAYREKGGKISRETSTFFNYLAMKLYDSLADINKEISG